jgi:DNA-binding transcriptional regulator YiaG
MARISKYENTFSKRSSDFIDAFLKITITPNEIDEFQDKYGVSNKELSRLSGHGESQISTWKAGRTEMPARVQQHFKLLFACFSQNLDKK